MSALPTNGPGIAEWCLASGYRPVPLSPPVPGDSETGKNPSIEGKGWWDRASAPDTYNPARFNNRNVGIACGYPLADGQGGYLLAVDIDVDVSTGKDGFQQISDLERLHGPLPRTRTHSSGKGEHRLFRTRSPLRGRDLASAINTRGQGGQIVAPYNYHYSGRAYAVTDEAPIAWAPEWLEAKLSGPSASSAMLDVDSVPVDEESRTIDQWREALRNAEQGIGLRRKALQKMIYPWVRALRETMPDDQILLHIVREIKSDLDTREHRTGALRLAEWEDTVRLIRGPVDTVLAEPRPIATPGLPPALAPAPGPVPTASDWGLSSADEIARPLPPARWLSREMQLGPGRPIIVAGYGSSGKTLSTQSLALSVASGLPIWGRYPCTQGAVIHLDYEQGTYATHRRYQRLARGMGVRLAELGAALRVKSFPERALTTPGMVDALSILCEGAVLLIVDSLRAATPGVDENDSKIRDFIQVLAKVTERTGCAALLIHHARKPAEGDGDIRTILRGSSAIFDAAGSVYALTAGKTGKDPRKVEHAKSPAEAEGAPIDSFQLLIEDLTGDVDCENPVRVVCRDEEKPEEARKNRHNEISSRIHSLILTWGQKGVSKTFIRTHAECNRDAAMCALEELIADGRVLQNNGQYFAAEVVNQARSWIG